MNRQQELKASRDKHARARAVVGSGEGSLLCDPGSELRLGGEKEKEEREKKHILNPLSCIAWRVRLTRKETLYIFYWGCTKNIVWG